MVLEQLSYSEIIHGWNQKSPLSRSVTESNVYLKQTSLAALWRTDGKQWWILMANSESVEAIECADLCLGKQQLRLDRLRCISNVWNL